MAENQLPVFLSPPSEVFRFTPSKSSPLRARSHNMNWASFSSPTSKIDFFPPSPPSSPPSSRVSSVNTDPARRKFRPNPIMQTPEDARERRRNLFLKKLRTNREDKIMQARGGEDEMMRLVFISEQRRWENMHERAAPTFITPDDEEAEMLALQDHDAMLAEEMLALENQELEAMFESQNQPPAPRVQQQPQYVLHEDDEMMYEDNQMGDVPQFASQLGQVGTQSICQCCGADELVPMQQEIICFNCGWSYAI